MFDVNVPIERSTKLCYTFCNNCVSPTQRKDHKEILKIQLYQLQIYMLIFLVLSFIRSKTTCTYLYVFCCCFYKCRGNDFLDFIENIFKKGEDILFNTCLTQQERRRLSNFFPHKLEFMFYRHFYRSFKLQSVFVRKLRQTFSSPLSFAEEEMNTCEQELFSLMIQYFLLAGHKPRDLNFFSKL